jgi:hypothetical protein
MTADVDWNPSIFDHDIDDVVMFSMPMKTSVIMDPFIRTGSIGIELLSSIAPATNHSSLIPLSAFNTMTWLMICLTYGSLPMF